MRRGAPLTGGLWEVVRGTGWAQLCRRTAPRRGGPEDTRMAVPAGAGNHRGFRLGDLGFDSAVLQAVSLKENLRHCTQLHVDVVS